MTVKSPNIPTPYVKHACLSVTTAVGDMSVATAMTSFVKIVRCMRPVINQMGVLRMHHLMMKVYASAIYHIYISSRTENADFALTIVSSVGILVNVMYVRIPITYQLNFYAHHVMNTAKSVMTPATPAVPPAQTPTTDSQQLTHVTPIALLVKY